MRACVRACCAMLRWCDAWSGGRATGTGREEGAAGGKTLRVWGGGARGEDPRAWAAPRLIALPWLPTAPSHAAAAPAEQAYFILDEVLLAGELQEPSKKARRGWGGVGGGGGKQARGLAPLRRSPRRPRRPRAVPPLDGCLCWCPSGLGPLPLRACVQAVARVIEAQDALVEQAKMGMGPEGPLQVSGPRG